MLRASGRAGSFRVMDESTKRPIAAKTASMRFFVRTILHDAGENLARRLRTGQGGQHAPGVLMTLAAQAALVFEFHGQSQFGRHGLEQRSWQRCLSFAP